eukprot:Hpha_TRINITY_DN17919_c0_g1::TRINITY_DN17919_c0_g1_i1::g.33833::m.33833
MLRAAFRRTPRLSSFYRRFFDDEGEDKLQGYETELLPTRQLAIERGTVPQFVTRLRINTDGSCDLKRYELWPTDGPEVVFAPCDKASRHQEVQKRRAILSGIAIDDIDAV